MFCKNKFWNRINHSSKKYLSYLIPLYYINNKNRPALLGTALLIRINDKYFILTAAHVIDENKYSTIYYPGKNKLKILNTVFETISLPESRNREDDIYDFAFSILNNSIVNELKNKFSFFPVNRIDPNDIPSKDKFYTIIGFPGTKSSAIPSLKKIKSKAFAFTSVSDEKSYKKIGVSDRTHLVLNFDKKESLNSEANKFTSPDPHGMSGGGVWLSRIIQPNKVKETNKLIGLGIEYRKSLNILVAVKMSLILECIRKKYPGLNKYIPKCNILKINVNFD